MPSMIAAWRMKTRKLCGVSDPVMVNCYGRLFGIHHHTDLVRTIPYNFSITHLPTGLHTICMKSDDTARYLVEYLAENFSSVFDSTLESDILQRMPKTLCKWLRKLQVIGEWSEIPSDLPPDKSQFLILQLEMQSMPPIHQPSSSTPQPDDPSDVEGASQPQGIPAIASQPQGIPKTLESPSDEDFKLAISLDDLDRMDPFIRQRLLKNRVDLDRILCMYLSPTGAIERCADIPGGEGEYEVAVGFTCSLRDASILVDVLRSEDRKMGDPPTRVYIYKRPVGWKRLPKDAVLTVIMDAKVHLNPKVFGDSQIPVVSKTPMAVKFGSS